MSVGPPWSVELGVPSVTKFVATVFVFILFRAPHFYSVVVVVIVGVFLGGGGLLYFFLFNPQACFLKN